MAAPENSFATDSAAYAAFRPTYPAEMIRAIAAFAPARHLAWDCGTGNGQAAIALADHFDRVVATDPSAEQVSEAPAHARVRYAIAAERVADIASHTVDLVTVAQALHWFDLSVFYAEVDRVLVPNGALAVWTYLRPRINDEIDRVIDWFHDERVGTYWPPGRAHVDAGYRTLPFPYPELPSASWAISSTMSREAFTGYVSTWSSVKRARTRDRDPLPEFAARLSPLWPAGEVRSVTWPIVLRVGRRPT